MSQDHVRLVELVATLQTSHEIDKLLELFADDATFEDVALGRFADDRADLRLDAGLRADARLRRHR